jgi:hypothetical protein
MSCSPGNENRINFENMCTGFNKSDNGQSPKKMVFTYYVTPIYLSSLEVTHYIIVKEKKWSYPCA